jgi:Gas vesicle synthesis protein GvpO
MAETAKNTTHSDKKESADSGLGPLDVVRAARDQLAQLTGMTAEAVSSFTRSEGDGGWTLTVEVLELERVPDTTSLLASYEVTVDDRGILTGYRRVRRYERGRGDS